MSPRSVSASRARRRRLRRLAGLGLVLAPTAWALVSDVVRRAHDLGAFDHEHRKAYAASLVESLVFWGVALYAGSRRHRRGRPLAVVFVVLFTLAMGVEGAFHAFYNVYLSIDGQIHSRSIGWSLVGTLPLSRAVVAANLAGAAAVGALLVHQGRRLLRARGVLWYLSLLGLPGVIYAAGTLPVSYRTVQSTLYDMIYFHGLGALVRERLGVTHDSPDLRVQRRTPESVPRLTPRPARPRNLLFILQESQRADVTCTAYDPDCRLATRFTNPLLPDRLPLLQLRSNASTTAISISNLWSGVRPTESRETLQSAPLLWDYAHAAGYDTAYWTSQNMMFSNSRLFVQDIPVSHRAGATNLDSQADIDTGCEDALVTDRAIAEWGELKEPFVAVVHYSNIHWPYVYDESLAPFQPSALDKSPEKNETFKNYYRNVVYLSDRAVARLIRHVRASAAGPRTVIAYTSDHGEAFREHWQLGHTSSLYDEEIHVPGWIDAPPGTLAPEEEASLRAAREQTVWHLDLATTFFDLIGVWDDPAFAPFRARMMGHPLTRPERTTTPVPLTNCSWLWECAFRNWGMMAGPLKLEAREWDNEYHCFNVRDNPREENNLGEQACWPLPNLARSLYHVMPNVPPPGRAPVEAPKK